MGCYLLAERREEDAGRRIGRQVWAPASGVGRVSAEVEVEWDGAFDGLRFARVRVSIFYLFGLDGVD